VNDAERLRHDPAMRWIVGGKAAQSSGFAESDWARTAAFSGNQSLAGRARF
jgi:hypothetical protein